MIKNSGVQSVTVSLNQTPNKQNANFNILANHISLHGRPAVTIISILSPNSISINHSASKG